MKLLMVQSNEKLSDKWCDGLRKCGYSVDVCSQLGEAIELWQLKRYNIIIIDVDENNSLKLTRDFVEKTRQGYAASKILVITEKQAVGFRIQMINLGVNDYLIKPFEFRELAARVRALQRLSQLSFEQLNFGKMKLNPAMQQIYVGENRLMLSKKEYLLLEFLLSNQGRVVRNEQMVRCMFEEASDTNLESLAELVCSLNAKLREAKHCEIQIENIRGIGYMVDSILL